MTENQRNDAITIAMAEEKTKADKSGKYYRIKAADGKWYSCFEHPLTPEPAAGQVWTCNIVHKGEWTNLHDMLYTDGGSAVPLAPPSATTPPSQPDVTHEDVREGPDRQTSIIRQSCLKAAAAACNIDMMNPEESTKTVLSVAEAFYNWVTR